MGMYRFIASIAVCTALLLGQNKAVTDAKALMKEKKFEEAVAILEPAAKAAPKDAVVKKTYVEALMGNADAYMYNDKLPPFKKYPTALRGYRKVVELEPTNTKAKDNVAMIENIYKSMGRPVPQ